MTVPTEDADSILARCPSIGRVFEDGVARQLHRGLQLYVSQGGEVLLNGGLGLAQPDRPMTADTRTLWLSAGKPLTAVLFARLWERGLVGVDDLVTKTIPEFGQGGKQGVTLRHLLTHTGGFRTVDTGWPELPWERVIDRICHAPLETGWVVGTTAGYHPHTSWFILGEVLARAAGVPYAELVQREVLDPLGMSRTSVVLSPEQAATVQEDLGWMWGREAGGLKPFDWHEPPRLSAVSPGSNFRGPLSDLGRFYERLVQGGSAGGEVFLREPTVAALTARHRVGEFDQTLAHVVDFGLGMIINSRRYGPDTVPYGYGELASARTFGHGGSQSSVAFGDPERQVVVAFAFNGMCGEGQHQRRARQLLAAVEQDLFPTPAA